MRARTKSNRILLYPLIVLLACFLLVLALSVPVARADLQVIYSEADVLLGGEPLPSSLTFTGSAYSFGFDLYKSTDLTSWEKDEEYKSDFQLRFYNQNGTALSQAPQAVGSYIARVVAINNVYGHKNTTDQNSIVPGIVVGEKRFTIVRENLSLFCTALDGKSSLTLGEVTYSELTSGIALYLNGVALNQGADYTFEIQKKNGGAFESASSIAEVNTYRIRVVMDPSLETALSRTIVSNSLGKEDNKYVMYREFSVIHSQVSLSLSSTSMYEDKPVEVSLTNSAQIAAIASYKTQVVRLSSDGSANASSAFVKAYNDSGAVAYTPTEAGDYLYRVIFTAAAPSYNVTAGDYLEAHFTVAPKPYYVKYYINGDPDNELDFVKNNPSEDEFDIVPVFYYLDGTEIHSVYYDSINKRYSVKYQIAPSWTDVTTLKNAGKYRVVITFDEPAQLYSDYTIEIADPPIEKEFQIVTSGNLNVVPANNGVNYYTGLPVQPDLIFYPTASASALTGKYDLYYYQADGTSIGTTAPVAVGNYSFKMVIKQDIASLNLLENDEFYGTFSVVYHSLYVTIGDTVTFKNEAGAPVSLELGTDYIVESYLLDKGVYHTVSDTSAAGNYVKRVVYIRDLPLYAIRQNSDFAYYAYTISGASVLCTISSQTLNRVYDAGVKEPVISFSNGSSISLTELVDYQISYFRKQPATNEYLPVGRMVDAGSYRCIVTYLRTDETTGIERGMFTAADIEISPIEVKATFSVSSESHDLVYDATEKTFHVDFTLYSRPISLGHTLTYAVNDGSAFGSTAFRNVGSYLAKATLSDTSGNYVLDHPTYAYRISALSLKTVFIVPLSYRAMWTGAAVGSGQEIVPEVKYVALNGHYSGTPEVARTEAEFAALGITLSESKAYYRSNNDTDFDIPAEPVLTGKYCQEISVGNANVVLSQAAAFGDDGNAVSIYKLQDGKAYQLFSIIPREVEIKKELDDNLFFTGTTDADRKGIKDGKVFFYAYNGDTEAYDIDITSRFTEEFSIYYYESGSDGTIISGSVQSTVKPYAKSYYVARISLEAALDGEGEYINTYIKNGCYTFKNGKMGETSLAGSAISNHCYVDFVFQIKQQSAVDLIYEMPTFAYNGQGKAIKVFFQKNFSTLDLEEGDGKDYKITYLDSENNEQSTPYSAVGSYRMRITMLKSQYGYVLNSYVGDYLVKANDLYISAGDTLEYAFEIFAPRTLRWEFTEPSSLYYDGQQKTFGVNFYVEESGTRSVVTLTSGTHYRFRYYANSNDGYKKLSSAPQIPGEYAVEIAFLCDLPDYELSLLGGGTMPVTASSITTIEGASGNYSSAKTPRRLFTVQKAVLMVNGIVAEDKVFDATNTVTFNVSALALSVKKVGQVSYGSMVAESEAITYALDGNITGHFSTLVPSEDPISIILDSVYALPASTAAYYTLEYPSVYQARITKSVVTVTPLDVTREYDPMAIDSIIKYTLSYDQETLALVFPSLKEKDMMVGALSYSGGKDVGFYPIDISSLALNDAGAGTAYTDKHLSDLFTLSVENAVYHITQRHIVVSVTPGQSKIYNDSDPTVFAATVTSGSLNYHDSIEYSATRASGENVGTYLISLKWVKVVGNTGVDISSNYDIEMENATFEITKRHLTISPNAQSKNYLTPFDTFDLAVLDTDSNTDLTNAFVKNPTKGDRLSGKLARSATPISEEEPRKFRILRGSIIVVTEAGRNNESNYDITFVDSAIYEITTYEIEVKLASDAVLQKYYGDLDPIISYTISNEVVNALKPLTISATSSIGRSAGENVGTYDVLKTNASSSFVIYDGGKDVSDYFTVKVTNLAYDGEKEFRILPRPVTVTIEDATYQNNGREIIPVLKYLNANGTRVSATVLASLNVRFGVPTLEYKDGANLVTPVVISDVDSDPNFDLTIKPGTITVNYLQNTVTATPLPKTDTIYAQQKYILSGLMLYKTVKFYKLETANGQQPTRLVEISLPLEEQLKGDGLVVVALHADGSTKALSFTQSGQSLLYYDDGAYYVAVAEMQEWFYVIWGVVLVIGCAVLYLVIRLFVKVIKKRKAKKALQPAGEKKQKKAKTAKKQVQEELTEEQIREFAAMDVALLDENLLAASQEEKLKPIKPVAAEVQNAEEDALFTDQPLAPTPAPIVKSKPASSEGSELLSSDADTSSMLVDAQAAPEKPLIKKQEVTATNVAKQSFAPVETAPVVAESDDSKSKKDKKEKDKKVKEKPEKVKKEKEKKEKPDKKDKKKDSNDKKQPRSFTPGSFVPRGDKTAAYAPTRSYMDDLFIDEMNEEEASLLSDNAAGDDLLSDSNVIAPTTMPKQKDNKDDDEIIVSKSGGFTDDLDEAENEEKDNDLL